MTEPPAAPSSPALRAKRSRVLEALAAPAGRLAVAFSGGVDSTLLLALALEARGPERVVAVTAVSDSLARDELVGCRELAARLGAELELLATREMDRPGYVENSPRRCYHCKAELFDAIDAARLGGDVAAVAYGATRDDLGDHRPGMEAAREHAVLAPLADAGLGKDEIRALSRELGLPTWDKPAQPCLASRIPYGEPVSPEKLARIDGAERLLREVGVREGRVRHHGDEQPIARVEVPPTDLPALVAEPARSRLVEGLRALGFRYVTVDLEGFRSGRLNEVLGGVTAARRLPTAPAAARTELR